MKNKNLILVLGSVLLFGIFVLIQSNLVIAQEVSYCAERTNSGAWCQNVPFGEVDQNYRSVPTSCDATSYCKLGTCVNSQEGTCLDNTPQIVCAEPQDDISGGVWFDDSPDNIPRCSLGCCLLGDQASFVTQVRCKQLSSLYGLETNYRTDIQSEIACIATATSEVKGACVFEQEFERTCRQITRGECQKLSGGSADSSVFQNLFGAESSGGDVSVEFHEGILCSAEELATNCGPSKKTTLIKGGDEVYFVDTCGNVANIYDASKVDDQNYWRDVVGKAESCGFGNSNAGSATCGNCDYFSGSTGKLHERGTDPVTPLFGDYICRDLSCIYERQNFQHGETWCAISSEDEENLPGSRYHRLVCYNSEVTVESCADFRQEICIQDELNGFKTAACRVNIWQDCTSQTNQRDCENLDKRDCSWEGAKCLPKFAPGFDFWESEGGDAEQLCSLGTNNCVIKYEKGIFDDWKCVENCECLGDDWAETQNNLCINLGDCGSITNYIGSQGYYEVSDAVIKSEIK